MKKTVLALSLLCLYQGYVQAQTLTEKKVPTVETLQGRSHLQQHQIIVEMRNTWRNNFIPSSEIEHTLLQNYVSDLNKVAHKLWSGIDKNAREGQYWSDTRLDDASMQGRLKLGPTLYTIYQRIFTLAKAWATPGTDLYHSTPVRTVIINMLITLNARYYNVDTPEWGNWWNWELGIARSINNTMVVMFDDLPDSLIKNYNQATRHFVRDPRYLAEGSGAPYSTMRNAVTSTGGNRTDSAQVVFVRGLLEEDTGEISAAVASVPEVLNIVQSGDGFYADGSFIQHKDLPYSGTYGQVLLNGLGLIKNSIAGTAWDFSAQQNQRIYQVIRQSFLPLMYEGRMSDAVNGRSISRRNGQDQDTGITVMNAVALFIDGAPPAEKLFLEKAIKAQLTPQATEYYRTHLPENLNAWQVVTRILQDKHLHPVPAAPGGKLYADMDRLVYRGKGYFAVIAMHSRRTGSYECINNENRRGQRTSDGMTYLYLSGDAQYNGYWPVVDSRWLPGTTSVASSGICDEQYRVDRQGKVNISWAGGVTLDRWASASMHLKVPASQVKAKKSWFMAPDMLVMLGSDISGDGPTFTTIANRRVSGSAQVISDGVPVPEGTEKTITHPIMLNDQENKIVWQPLTDTTALVSRKNRIGDWSDIGTSSGVVSAQFLTILQPHKGKADNHYAWAVYPGQSVAQQSEVNIVANNAKVQSILLPRDGTQYANFWQPTTAGDIRALTPLAMIMIPTTQGFRIAVSSPRRDSRVSFRLPGHFLVHQDKDKRVSLHGDIISVDVSHLRGSSYVFEIVTDK
ncbi:TPA: polysaccharide lyase 8 family protein [Salmonella enterica subsp. diarizonae serovar 61:l,v:z35]|nr:sugar lyase [Salmonella enterica subsp. enterica serovar Newport]